MKCWGLNQFEELGGQLGLGDREHRGDGNHAVVPEAALSEDMGVSGGEDGGCDATGTNPSQLWRLIVLVGLRRR